MGRKCRCKRSNGEKMQVQERVGDIQTICGDGPGASGWERKEWMRLKYYLLLLLLLSRFSRVWFCETPETAAHQATLSLGFSRQEHWGGLPFPSPMHESEKWKWSRSVVSDSVFICWWVDLCPCPVICLVWGVLELAPTDLLAQGGAGS